MSDRFLEWIDNSPGDRSELNCTDSETGATFNRPSPNSPETRKALDAWKREQELKTKARAA